jgi:uncharacterized protein
VCALCVSAFFQYSIQLSSARSSTDVNQSSAFFANPFPLLVALPLQTLRLDGSTSSRGNTVAKEDRGFASMDRARQREIASKGGKAAHQKGTAHEWTSEEARDAGRKGGLASHRRRREQREPQEGVTGGGASNEEAGGTSEAESE